MPQVDIEAELLARMLRLVEVNAYCVWSAVLCGNQNPRQQRMYERMKDYKIGDLVMEISTIWFKGTDSRFDTSRAASRIGVLKNKTREPFPDWDEEEQGEPSPLEEVHYIETLDGRMFRWTNANFVAIPDDMDWSR